jgi:hypothetical protein
MTVEPYDRTMSTHPTLFEDKVIEQWNNGAATIVEATVTYTRKHSSTISLPVATIFMDVAPLFAS